MRQKRLVISSLFVLLTLLTGCQTTNQSTNKITVPQNFKKTLIKTKPFTLTTFQKFSSTDSASNQPVTIYIEGDGRTWITRTKLSDNPTPKNPLALKLAILDNSANVAYLARPCQYTPHSEDPACNPTVWSNDRFSETVIQSMNEAIETLKKSAKSNRIHLVGFSGGAAIAALIAARRHDVASLRTVAGDLNHEALSNYHHTTPLKNSENPITIAPKLVKLPQQHFSGKKDKTVPPFIAEGFVNAQKQFGGHCATQIIIPNATHHAGWEAIWPTFLQKPFLCVKNQV